MKHKQKYSIILILIVSCVVMALVDAVLQPGYITKSIIKIVLFLALPFTYAYFGNEINVKKLFTPKKNGIKILILLGFGIYFIIVFAYLALKGIFDFSAVTTSLNNSVGVNKENFVWVSLYISFVNSLLEEFFFRGFAFISLKEVSSRKFAYIFSSVMFALYHIAMMIGWFDIEIIILAIIGLIIGGMIFNFCNEKSGNIYTSWLIHMFANFAINTVGFILFGII